MSNHTPGPWSICNDGFVYDKNGERVCSPHSTLPGGERYKQHRKSWQQNARLIAAAPDLLAALKGAVACEEHYDGQIAAWVAEAHAAIAKAEGTICLP